MKSLRIFLLVMSILMLTSCHKNSEYGNPEVDISIIQKNFMNWWDYYSNNIILSSDFIPLDENSKIINKENFLKLLTSGNYIPIKLNSSDKLIYYKLYKLEPISDASIKPTIINESSYSFENFKREGSEFPEFNFKDLDGNVYNKETTKEKIIVLKCWFIHCHQCVQEMPELNKLVKEYGNRKDIIFISLATDTNQELEIFLTKKTFNYAVIPNQKSYITETLNISTYPTHLIINKKGLISKVVSNYKELSIGLKKESLLK
jgi:thiol-disulfide isomerase/thioredoxin